MEVGNPDQFSLQHTFCNQFSGYIALFVAYMIWSESVRPVDRSIHNVLWGIKLKGYIIVLFNQLLRDYTAKVLQYVTEMLT